MNLRFFTCDFEVCPENYDVYAEYTGAAGGIRPPQSMIGASRLVLAGLKIEIEASAAS